MSCFLGRRGAVFLFCLSLSFRIAANAPAATITWDGGGADNLWHTPENWSGDVLPDFGDDVVFNGTSTKTCELAEYAGVASVTIEPDFTGSLVVVEVGALWVHYFTQRGGHVDWGASGNLDQHKFRRAFVMEGGTADASNASFYFWDNQNPEERRPFRVAGAPFELHSLTLIPELQGTVILEVEGDLYVSGPVSVGTRPEAPSILLQGRHAQLVIAGSLKVGPQGSINIGKASTGRAQLVVAHRGYLDASEVDPAAAKSFMLGQIVEFGSGSIYSPANDFGMFDADGLPAPLAYAGGSYTIALSDWDENKDGRDGEQHRDRVAATLVNEMNGDIEVVVLLETGPSTGRFAAAFPPIAVGPAVSGDGVMQTTGEANTVSIQYQDVDDRFHDPDDLAEVLVVQVTIDASFKNGLVAR